jgi:hypothetical protein
LTTTLSKTFWKPCSKAASPPNPASAQALDYLLATPFRYNPLRGGSRFRAITDPGVFYGAESVRTASAELGYWRWRFLKDAVDLEKLEPVAHTAFSADVSTHGVDLRQPPFNANAAAWLHPTDYSATQALCPGRTPGWGRRHPVPVRA